MQICGQTLILVDCDSRVNEVNQKIVKATLEYMFNNGPDNRAYFLTSYGHEVEGIENFTTDRNVLLNEIEELKYSGKDTSLTDVLCEVIARWKESDFACRDIVVFTDGIEEEALNYEREELFYLLNSTSYPIYVVDLIQDNNQFARKELSAIATTSGGKLFPSEFPGDDADVNVQIAESIFGKMDEYAQNEWAIYEQTEDDGAEEQKEEEEYIEETYEDTASMSSYEDESDAGQVEEIIYTDESQPSNISSPGGVVIGLIGFLVMTTMGLILGFYTMKVRHKNAKEEKVIRERVQSKIEESPKEVFFNMKNDDENVTRILNYEDNSSDKTMLLTNVNNRNLQLNNIHSGETMNISLAYPCVLGRNSEYSNVVLDDSSVSKRHCEIGYCDDGYYIKDLSSANGVYINNCRISNSLIKSGDVITIGQNQYEVVCL